MNQSELKKHIKSGELACVYLLYGDEPYMISYYTDRISALATDGTLAEFNLQRLDGRECGIAAIENAVEALPVMSDRKCVVVRSLDVAKLTAADAERLNAIVSDPPDSCVLVFQQENITSGTVKNAKWKALVKAADKHSVCVSLDRKSENEIIKMLCSGANKRGCVLSPADARLMIQRRGNDLTLLLSELEKVCAAAGEGMQVTGEIITAMCVENLESTSYKLADSIIRCSYAGAYEILNMLFAAREEPIRILGALSSVYADLYRVRVVHMSDERPETLVNDFSYKGKEFVLRNAYKNSMRLSIGTLRKCLDVLADADRMLKSLRCDQRVVLEQTASRLIMAMKSPGDSL